MFAGVGNRTSRMNRKIDSRHSVDGELPQALRSTFYQLRFIMFLPIITTTCIVFTIVYAYNASSASPFSPRLHPSNPSKTIRILNILSHVTVFLLQTLTSGLFETIRWAFAVHNGVPALTMMSLSADTSFLSVLYLLLSQSSRGLSWGTGHHLWGFQRLFWFNRP